MEGKWKGKQGPMETDEDGEWPQACSQEHEVKGRQSMGGVVENVAHEKWCERRGALADTWLVPIVIK